MQNLERFIREVPDFPRKGIGFKDITTLLKNPPAYRAALDALQRHCPAELDAIVAIESRGFIFGAALADRLGTALVPARKPGKLPAETVREEYALEYGTDALEIHRDAIRDGQRVLIVDDLLATGGTAAAAARLVEKLGGRIAGCLFLIELAFLNGRQALSPHPVTALISYKSE